MISGGRARREWARGWFRGKSGERRRGGMGKRRWGEAGRTWGSEVGLLRGVLGVGVLMIVWRGAGGLVVGAGELFFVGEDFGDVLLDPLVVHELGHEDPAVGGGAELFLEGVGALLLELFVLGVEGLFHGLVFEQQGVHGVVLFGGGAEQIGRAHV